MCSITTKKVYISSIKAPNMSLYNIITKIKQDHRLTFSFSQSFFGDLFGRKDHFSQIGVHDCFVSVVFPFFLSYHGPESKEGLPRPLHFSLLLCLCMFTLVIYVARSQQFESNFVISYLFILLFLKMIWQSPYLNIPNLLEYILKSSIHDRFWMFEDGNMP